MGSISLPTLAIIAVASSVAAAGASAYASHEQGVAASNQAKMKARVAADTATQQQINQRQNLMRALASQNAQAGAGGIGTGGSFGANAQRQITQNQNDLLVTGAGASAQIEAYNQQASSASLIGNIGAGTSLLDGASSAAKGYGNYQQAVAAQKKLG